MKYLDLHGQRVAYREAGAGEALLLIHGMAGSSATWRAVLPQLSKKYRVVAPDLFGHGESAKPRGDYSLGAFAVSLRDLLDDLGISRATVVGQSLGGGVAMQFTYQHRDYCERLVLISSGGLGPDLSWILRMLSAPGAELVLPVVAPQPVLNVGNKLGSWLTSAGIYSPRAEMWNAYSSLSDGEWTPADVSHDPSVLATFNTGRDATTGNTNSTPGADSIRSVKLRSGPSPPLLIRTSRSQ